MLKHSYHARLSIWHVVLLVIILAISLPVIAEPISPSPHQSPVKTSWHLARMTDCNDSEQVSFR